MEWFMNKRKSAYCKVYVFFLKLLILTSVTMSHKLGSKQLRVAVVGGGFAGLSIAQRLSPHAEHISVIDMMPPGKAGASAAAGGLLHPLSSRGGFVWRGIEGYEESKLILEQLQHTQSHHHHQRQQDTNQEAQRNLHLYDYPVEILRPLLKESDVSNWLKAAQTTSKDWLEVVTDDEFQSKTGFFMKESGILKVVKIKNAIVVNPIDYLLSLWQSVQSTCPSTEWQLTSIPDQNAVWELSKSYDAVILAVGPSLQQLWSDRPEHQFFLKYVKGQNQLYRNDKSTSPHSPLTGPLLSGEYIVPRSDENELYNSYLVCGATHEHLHRPSVVDLQKMMQSSATDMSSVSTTHSQIDLTLKQRLAAFYPHLQDIQPFKLTSGVRLVTERTELGKIPIIGRHPWLNNVWSCAGLGARGLVYHALMSKYLHHAILDNDETTHIPKPLHPVSHYLLK